MDKSGNPCRCIVSQLRIWRRWNMTTCEVYPTVLHAKYPYHNISLRCKVNMYVVAGAVC